MRSERLKLRRARLIERIRKIEKRQRAGESLAAEELRARLEALAWRSDDLAASYSGQNGVKDGRELRDLVTLGVQVRAMAARAQHDAARAREMADRRLGDLAAATRRHQDAQDRAAAAGHAAIAARLKAGEQEQAAQPRRTGTLPE